MGCQTSTVAQPTQPVSSNGTLLGKQDGNAATNEIKVSECSQHSVEQALKRIFDGIDADGDGKVETKELNSALRKSEEIQRLFDVKYNQSKGNGKGTIPPTPGFFKSLIDKFDSDGDGKISCREFTDYFFPTLSGQEDSLQVWPHLWTAFNTVDADSDGKICAAELNKALRENKDLQRLFNVEYYGASSKGKGKGCAPPTPVFFKELISKLDTDGDDQISWHEFVDYFGNRWALKAEAVRIFKLADQDGSGFINMAELANLRNSKRFAETMMDAQDANADGKLSLPEWLVYVKSISDKKESSCVAMLKLYEKQIGENKDLNRARAA